MYKNILQQIANTVFINIQHQESFGLLDGKMGITLFLYNYARYTGNKIYSDLAGELIDQIYESLAKHGSKIFYDGLAGIAYGFDYIIKNNFVETDEEDGDILEEVDSILSEMDEATFCLELDSDLPLFGKGLYFLQRKDKYSLSKIAEECLLFLSSQSQKIPLSYINSILYFVNKALLEGEITLKVSQRILEILFNECSGILADNDYKEVDIYILKKNIENLQDSTVKDKWAQLTANYKCTNIDLADKPWIHFLYKYGNEEDWFIYESEFQERVNNTVQNLSNEDLNLYKGLTGIGLELIRLSNNTY